MDFYKVYKKIKEDALMSMDAGVSPGMSADGIFPTDASGIEHDDILGNFDPDNGVLGKDNYYMPVRKVKTKKKKNDLKSKNVKIVKLRNR